MAHATVQSEYTIRRKIFTVLGAKFHIFNQSGEMIGFSQQKAFRLKEDIRVFTDESKSQPLLSINARSVIDFSAAYDVTETSGGASVGALRRKGLSSMVRDEWMVLDPSDTQIGSIKEDSTSLALARRFLPMGNLIPQKYHLTSGPNAVYADYRTHFNPFVHKMSVSVYNDCPISPLLVLAAGILLIAVEGRQEN